MKKELTILGIETSCDETAASLLKIKNCKLKIMTNIVSSQVKIHAQYGGVVPEVAARKHAENIIGVLENALNNQKSILQIDAIAVTNGPGLITSLLVGVEAAKTLAFLGRKPLIPVNHLIGHIYANFIGKEIIELESQKRIDQRKSIFFPAICLVVSGGHTELILMKDFEKFKKIGQSLDDAAGECFDKVAKILGLGYPGGPKIANEATKIKNKKIENIDFPRPMINSDDFNFSFSGLKTAVLYKTQELDKLKTKKFIPIICKEVQQAIIDVLITKTVKAAKRFKAKSIILGGGVAANQELRKQFTKVVKEKLFNSYLFLPDPSLCTDNAAMIAAAGYFKLKKISQKDWFKKFDWRKIKIDPNLEI